MNDGSIKHETNQRIGKQLHVTEFQQSKRIACTGLTSFAGGSCNTPSHSIGR